MADLPPLDIAIFQAPGCAHADAAVAEVRRALDALDRPDARVRVVRLDTDADARRLGVAGSPTVRVNGRDVDHVESRPNLGCRDYVGDDGRSLPYPPASLLREAIAQAGSAAHTAVD